ncbi:MAG TPA: hypothetical protein ENJ51_03080 [Leucothrix mucor]|uniref:Transposase IS701-like DDE domain-containing protein n=1 Tax=Leucothrix mucor TaxID=45248 RepID=A0A7V2WUH3_LEUMU|nr:hypothetical protein [Leucothrix mucor]
MLPLISIPEIVSHYAPHFEELFSKGEYKHFQKYLSGLIVSENKTVEAINRLFVLELQNQSSLNRFLTDSNYEVSKLNQKRLDLLNSQEATRLKGSGHRGGVLGLDDTMLIHYGKCFDEIAKLYDHASGTYVWAHNLVNLHYSDDSTDYPTYFELWKPVGVDELESGLRAADIAIKPKKEGLKLSAPKKWRNYLLYLYRKHQHRADVQQIYRSKIIIGQDLLRHFFEQYPNMDIPVSFDKWFTCPAFCRFIDKELQKAYVGGLKGDEDILLAGSKKIKVADFVSQLKTEHLSANASNPLFIKTTIKYKGKKEVFYNYCKVHHICGYGRQKLLISHQREDLSDTSRVFIGNRLHWRVQHMTRVGRHRWPVEEYHKEGKAEGLDQYQVRNFEAIEKHIALVALVYSLLQHARYNSALLNHLQLQLDTNIKGSIAFWRRTIQAQALWLLVQWIDNAIQQGWSLEQIMQTLKPAFAIE